MVKGWPKPRLDRICLFSFLEEVFQMMHYILQAVEILCISSSPSSALERVAVSANNLEVLPRLG
jgi:hypothetical protein